MRQRALATCRIAEWNASVLAALIALVLGGCSGSSKPLPLNETHGVPANRSFLFNTISPGFATVSVRRDGGFVGSGCSADIYVNGQRAARLETGESTFLYVPVGSTIFGVKADGVICDGAFAEQEAEAVADRILYFRVGAGMGSGMGLFRTNP